MVCCELVMGYGSGNTLILSYNNQCEDHWINTFNEAEWFCTGWIMF